MFVCRPALCQAVCALQMMASSRPKRKQVLYTKTLSLSLSLRKTKCNILLN